MSIAIVHIVELMLMAAAAQLVGCGGVSVHRGDETCVARPASPIARFAGWVLYRCHENDDVADYDETDAE